MLTHLECSRCGRALDAAQVQQRCPCGGTLLARYESAAVSLADVRARPPGMWRYRELLPVGGDPVSLGEPETPLVPLPRLSERWGIEASVKDESGLAGGTFKARGAAVGLSRAVELGVTRVAMPSAGNAGGAWALYAARSGVELTVTMAATAPAFNQAEVKAAGAILELVDGTIADAGRRAADIASETGAFLATTFSEPYRLEGKKTAWLEVFDGLGAWPRTIVLPVGGGVAAIALAKAAAEVNACGWAKGQRPRIIGVQPANCAPIVHAFEHGAADVTPWTKDPMTVAAGLRVPAPAEGTLVLETVRDSGGAMVAVSEEDILTAIRTLASNEGVFACPEGATTVAATERLARDGLIEGPVVLYNTGAGSKYSEVLV